MANENNNSTNTNLSSANSSATTPSVDDLDALINNMSSINSEDYWFTKITNIEEHEEKAP